MPRAKANVPRVLPTDQRHSPDVRDDPKAGRRIARSAWCLTFELSRLRRLAKPAVAGQLQRRVRWRNKKHVGLARCVGAQSLESQGNLLLELTKLLLKALPI